MDRLLDQTGETVTDALGGAAVEAEHVLVEVGLEVFGADRTVMGAEQPALGEAEDEMDAGQSQRGIAPGSAEIDRLVVITGLVSPA